VRRFFDALFGRSRPVTSKVERLFAVATAQVTQLSQELEELLKIGTRETGTRYEIQTDAFRFRWVLLTDENFEDLVATIHVVSQTLIEHQFGEQLLAGVFRFTTSENQALYWIYNYKRGSFYPFAPQGQEQKRDHALELRYSSAMQREMPIEAELERWYPLWGIPF
jgi:hypothetical protein